jgi:hypothetical protein
MRRILTLLAVCAVLLTVPAFTQVHGVPPSVTSITHFGPGPFHPNAPAPSVTSLGPNGFAPPHAGRIFGAVPRHGRGFPIFVPLYTPYLQPFWYPMWSDSGEYDMNYDPNSDAAANMLQQQQMPPTSALDRGPTTAYAGPETSRYGDHYFDSRERAAEAEPAPAPAPAGPNPESAVQPQPTTVLVFRDGHKLEVHNYAIQGDMLYNLSEEGPRKIALADLDVDATVRANDDRGVQFSIPR